MLLISSLLTILLTANGQQENLLSLSWLPRDITAANSGSNAIVMTVWVDTIIYTCTYDPTITQNVVQTCSIETCCVATGTYCDPALDGQLLVSNDDTDEIVIDELTLVTNDGENDLSYTMTNWCVDQADVTLNLAGFMATGGNAGQCASATPKLSCWLSQFPTTQCDLSYPGSATYDAICVSSDQCTPSGQLLFFSLDASGIAATDVLFMNGESTSTDTGTCNPTSDPTASDSTSDSSDDSDDSDDNAMFQSFKEDTREYTDNGETGNSVLIEMNLLILLVPVFVICVLSMIGIWCCVYSKKI